MPLLDLSVNYSVSVTRISAMSQQKIELGNLNLFSSLILVHAHIMFHGLLLVWLRGICVAHEMVIQGRVVPDIVLLHVN